MEDTSSDPAKETGKPSRPEPAARPASDGRPAKAGNQWHIALLIAASLASGFFGGYYGAVSRDDVTDGTSQSSTNVILKNEGALISDIAKNVGKSVVSVNVIGESVTQGFFGPTRQQQAGAGTGVIISDDGLIITNRHVVPSGTTRVTVTLSDGTELKDVEVVGRTGESDSLDIAFLKIKNTEGKKLTAAKLGDSSKVKVGDSVVAIGNALGQFQNTVTSGIISGYGRSVQASDGSGFDVENLEGLFQTDAAINEGNSGGPLVNLSGEVIGINTAVAGNAQNIGFAIPMNNVSGLIKTVKETGKLQRPYLGVVYISLTDDAAKDYGLSVSRGAYIAPRAIVGRDPIVEDSPASKANLRPGDIITAINGTKIDESHSLTSILGNFRPGAKVELTVVRDGKTIKVSVTLGAAPQE